MKLSFKALAAVALLSLSSIVSAAPITGSISFAAGEGGFSYSSTAVNFTAPAVVTQVVGGFGSYFAAGDAVDFEDFNYAPFALPQMIWSGTGSLSPDTVSFVLSAITSYFVSGSGNSLSFEGTGTVSNGTEDSMGIWSFSANRAVNGAVTYSFSSSTAAEVEVPEPSLLALFGLGLLGLRFARRRSIKA